MARLRRLLAQNAPAPAPAQAQREGSVLVVSVRVPALLRSTAFSCSLRQRRWLPGTISRHCSSSSASCLRAARGSEPNHQPSCVLRKDPAQSFARVVSITRHYLRWRQRNLGDRARPGQDGNIDQLGVGRGRRQISCGMGFGVGVFRTSGGCSVVPGRSLHRS
eukprot:COSAG06_NODE_43_length_29826_cov_32.009621_5_plen_163_part_00